MNCLISFVRRGNKACLLSGLLLGAGLPGWGCGKKEDGADRSARETAQAAPVGFDIVARPESSERLAVGQQARVLFQKGNFAELETMAKDLRENKFKFPNGDWHLRYFYAGLSDTPDDLKESDWRKLLKQGEEWRKQYPQSITASIILAELYRGYAWAARSSNWAGEVTEMGWQLMGERLGRAYQILTEAKASSEKCPGWHASVIHVALGLNMPRPEFEKLFTEAAQAFPDYPAIYDAKAFYLLSRWHGEEGEWEKFAISLMQRSDIPQSKESYARIAMGLRLSGVFYEEFSDADESWTLLKESFHELIKNHPDSLEIRSTFCLMSARLWDYKEAREVFKSLDNHADLYVWGKQGDFQKMIQWVAFDDEAMEKARQAAKARRQK